MEENNSHEISNKQFRLSEVIILIIITLLIGLILGLSIFKVMYDNSDNKVSYKDDEYLSKFIDNYNYLVDNYTDADGGSYSLNYKAVECNRMEYFGADYKKQKGACADLLADEGKQWLALYASKNSKAGKPLTPDFAVQESSTAANGYEGSLHIIGEKGVVNVASGAFRNYSTASQAWQTVAGDYTQYIFYKLSKDVKTYDESAGNMTASSIGSGTTVIIGIGSLIVGLALGAVVASAMADSTVSRGTGPAKWRQTWREAANSGNGASLAAKKSALRTCGSRAAGTSVRAARNASSRGIGSGQSRWSSR